MQWTSGSYRSWEGAGGAEGTWPVRQLQRLPKPVLVVAVALMTIWVLAWIAFLVVGFNVLSSY